MIRTKEELLSSIPALVGEERTEADETIAFLEDISDTLDNLSGQIAEDYKTKYEESEAKYSELDKTWRKKFVDRFMKGEPEPEPDEPDEPQSTDSLFKKEERQ